MVGRTWIESVIVGIATGKYVEVRTTGLLERFREQRVDVSQRGFVGSADVHEMVELLWSGSRVEESTECSG